jgi:hypothetical protein
LVGGVRDLNGFGVDPTNQEARFLTYTTRLANFLLKVFFSAINLKVLQKDFLKTYFPPQKNWDRVVCGILDKQLTLYKQYAVRYKKKLRMFK